MKDIGIYEIGTVLDTATSAGEQQRILALLETCGHVALDLSRCTYVSSAGLRVMLYACKTAKAKGGQVDLIGVSEGIREVMAMTGFDRFFTFYQTVDECINS